MKGGPSLDCPVSGCSNKRRSPRYAVCMDCWHLVPVGLRDQIRGYRGAIKSTRQGGRPAEQRRVALGFAAANQAAVQAAERRRAEAGRSVSPRHDLRGYAHDLDYHLGTAARIARLLEQSSAPVGATDRAKRVGQGARALRGMTQEIQEVLREQ